MALNSIFNMRRGFPVLFVLCLFLALSTAVIAQSKLTNVAELTVPQIEEKLQVRILLRPAQINATSLG